MAKISITRALTQLKMLDKRITGSIYDARFLNFEVNSKPDVKNFKPVEEFNSIIDLMRQQLKLKVAIMQSNLETTVTINGKSMTVVEAIEYKNIVKYKKVLIDQLETQRRQVRAQIERTNQSVQERLDDLLRASFAKDQKITEAEINAIKNPFLAANEAKEIDLINIDAEIERLKAEVINFEAEVDYVLSESNAITLVEIED